MPEDHRPQPCARQRPQTARVATAAGGPVAKHIAPVYLSEQIREEQHATKEAPAAPEFLASTLTIQAVEDSPGRPGVKLVTAALDVHNNVPPPRSQER